MSSIPVSKEILLSPGRKRMEAEEAGEECVGRTFRAKMKESHGEKTYSKEEQLIKLHKLKS